MKWIKNFKLFENRHDINEFKINFELIRNFYKNKRKVDEAV